MGKAERAELKRKQREQVKLNNARYSMTIGQVQTIMQQELKKEKDKLWKDNALDWYKMQLWIMHSRFRWGKKRLKMLHDEMIKEFELVHEGAATLDEINEELTKVGIKIV